MRDGWDDGLGKDRRRAPEPRDGGEDGWHGEEEGAGAGWNDEWDAIEEESGAGTEDDEEGPERGGAGATTSRARGRLASGEGQRRSPLSDFWSRTKSALGSIGPLLAESDLRERGAHIIGRFARKTSTRVATKLHKLGSKSKLILDDGARAPRSRRWRPPRAAPRRV